MYIAGIHVPGPASDLATESVITSTLFLYSVAMMRGINKVSDVAKLKGGPIKTNFSTRVGNFLTILHGSAIFLPISAYLVVIPLNKGVQPDFISRFALPDFGLKKEIINLIRLATCACLPVSYKAIKGSSDLLSHSFGCIGVRENSRILATSGLYSVVRHPIYTSILSTLLGLSVTFWNYIPLYCFAFGAVVFAVKIPIEERLIESDRNLSPEYIAYKKRVPSRLIPGIW